MDKIKYNKIIMWNWQLIAMLKRYVISLHAETNITGFYSSVTFRLFALEFRYFWELQLTWVILFHLDKVLTTEIADQHHWNDAKVTL